MSDPNRPTPTPVGGADTRPRDPVADRTEASPGGESPDAGAGEDPDALDQSVGRGGGEGGARSRDGAI